MFSSSSASSSSYFALHSGLTVARRLGVTITSPLALCQRMDGRLGLFTESNIALPSSSKQRHQDVRDDNSTAILSIPLPSTLHRFQRNFKPSAQNWRYAADVASTCNFPNFFEMGLNFMRETDDRDPTDLNPKRDWTRFDDPFENEITVDEQQALLQKGTTAALQERKWLEGSAALFIASSVVLAARQRKLERFMPSENSSDRAIVEQINWAFANNFPGFNVEIDEKGHNAPRSMEEVEARYHIMQACSHLEASLMDAVTTCEIEHAQRLFGELAEAPQTFTDVVTKAVETTVFGGVFAVPFRNSQEALQRRKHAVHISNAAGHTGFLTGVDTSKCVPLFYYAPYLSNINSAVDPWDANCVIDRTRDGFLVLKLLRPVKAGEELVKLEPRV